MHTLCSMANKGSILNTLALIAVLVLSSSVVPAVDAHFGKFLGLTPAQINNKDVNTQQNTNAAPIQPKSIFILAGQSNMAGRGGLFWLPKPVHWDGYTPDDMKPDNSTIFRLSAQLGWEVAAELLHDDIDPKMCGAGPGMAFANAVKGSLGTTIGLVPCAVGDTQIAEWQRGEALYENMIKRAKAAIQGGGEIKALLWYQGEADSVADRVTVYQSKMETLIRTLREDLTLPSLPVIQVAIAFPTGMEESLINRCGNSFCVDEIRKIQKAIQLPNVVTVDANGLPNKGVGDYIHLTTDSQVKVGHMLAEAYLKNFMAPVAAPSPPSLRKRSSGYGRS